MTLFGALIQKFIDLCEIPAIYEGISTDSITIDIIPISVYNYGVTVGVTIDCSDFCLADQIDSNHSALMEAMQRLNLAEIHVTIRKKYFREFSNHLFVLGAMNTQEIDLNSLYSSLDPVYIVAMHDETLMFANQAALLANEKTPDKFIGENFAALSYPDELEKRKQLLRREEKLTNYEFKAMHWYKDETIWRRKEVNLVVDLQKIEFWGIECRLGTELMIEETKRFVD